MFCYKIDKNKKLFTFLNPYSYLLVRKEKEIFKYFNIYIDGIALVKILHLIGCKDIKRQSFDMTSLAPIVFDNAIKENKSLYFIGTKPGVIDNAIKNLQEKFPALNIVGFRNGYIKDEEREKVLQKIVDLNPDIVVCGMGTPLQERFLLDLQKKGWKGIGYTCGGFLHQTAKHIQYYPKWIDKYHLRWAYRIYDESKLLKRYFWDYLKFLFVFIYDYLIYRLSKKIKH